MPAASGHFDELRGAAFELSSEGPQTSDATTTTFCRADVPSTGVHSAQTVQSMPFAPAWAGFFDALGTAGLAQLDQRARDLNQQIHDNGITYNVYAQAGSTSAPQRPWSLGLFPFLLTYADWQGIQAGVLQRARVLEAIMADVYGPQQLLHQALLPAALTQGHPGYLRAMHGARPAGGRYLHIVALDIARGPSGQWWVVSQRTQAPSGLGYLLENRAITSKLFAPAFKQAQVSPLEATYQSLVHSMRQLSPAGAAAHIALLSPGPYSATYFEQAYLARHLGLTLVEGADLTVRNQKLYLKTVHGLEPVHGLLKRLDDAFLDPLELRSDSSLGVPGLLQCIRAGNLLMANAPGSEFLESPALLGFMPGIAQALLGQQLSLPALPTWWCGERAALDAVLHRLGRSVIKPSYPGDVQQQPFEAMLGKYMTAKERDELAGRMLREGNAYTVQSYVPMSQMPTWNTGNGGTIQPQSAMLRVFAVSDGATGWRVLPGGLMRIASGEHEVASMQSGGSSADVWVTDGFEEAATAATSTQPAPGLAATLAPAQAPAQAAMPSKRVVTSRAAENLFWLGRYTERTECTLHAAQHILNRIDVTEPTHSGDTMRHWLGALAVQNSLVLPSVPSLAKSPRVFERSLLAALGAADNSYSIGFNLQALKSAAFTVRERLSQEQWDLIVQTELDFAQQCQRLMAHGGNTAANEPGAAGAVTLAAPSAPDVLGLLSATTVTLAAITGAQTDRMARDDGWRLLSVGRLLERLQFLASALLAGLAHGSVSFATQGDSSGHHQIGYNAMISLFDSTTTFRAHHRSRTDMAALLDTLVLDLDNPRSIAWVAKTLRGRLAKLAGDGPQDQCPLAVLVPDATQWQLADLLACDAQGQPQALCALLSSCTAAATEVAQALGAQYFTHAHVSENSVGA